MDGIDKDGRMYLCKKCHNILQGMILKWTWEYIPNELKEGIKDMVKRKTRVYVGDHS